MYDETVPSVSVVLVLIGLTGCGFDNGRGVVILIRIIMHLTCI